MEAKEITEIEHEAIKHYGTEKQIRKAIEEMGELITVLSREGNRVTHDEIITEIADVSIMIEQLGIIFGVNEVFQERCLKLKRLRDRIKKD